MAKGKPKRKARRARKKRKVSLYKSLPLGGFPKTKLVRLKYSDIISADPAAGAISTQVFRANGPYDPDSTGVGAQPSNWDVWSARYNRYQVMQSKITAEWIPVATSNFIPGTATLMLSEGGADANALHASGGSSAVIEGSLTSSRTMQRVGLANADASASKISCYYNQKKYFGMKGVGGGLFSDSSGTPAEQAYFEFSYMSSDDSSNPGAATFRVNLEYIILFTELDIAQPS